MTEWQKLRELTQSPLASVTRIETYQTSYRKRGGDRSNTMSRQQTMQVFDVATGEQKRAPMEEVDGMVKRAGFVTRAGSDALLKDKRGKITHEVWDYAKYIRWREEHPEAA